MKFTFKLILAVSILLSVAGGVNAQSGSKADQAKLPSNRPMPDHRVMQRKLEMMRAQAAKHNSQVRQENFSNPAQPGSNPTLQAYPNDIRRPAQKVIAN